jgi:hypothetical protein
MTAGLPARRQFREQFPQSFGLTAPLLCRHDDRLRLLAKSGTLLLCHVIPKRENSVTLTLACAVKQC